MHRVIPACFLMGVSACRNEPPPAPVLPVVTQREEEPPAPSDAYLMTSEKLDAFVKYQEAMVAVYADMFRDLEKVSLQGRKSLSVFKHKAEAEEKARQSAGLTFVDVREMEQVVHDVIATRNLAKTLRSDEAVRQMEQMRSKMPADQREAFERSIAEMKRQQDEFRNLSEARKKYGNTNVDLVLRREEALSKNWSALMGQFMGSRGDGAK